MNVDPQGVALHQLRLLRLGVQRDGVEPGVPRPAGAREGDALRRRPARRGQERAARGRQRRARDLGVHPLLLLQRALPEGRRPARRDREARRRVDQGGDRPRHGRQAREVVRHLGEDDRLAARDRARPEDAGGRRGDQADALRARPRACAARCRRRSRRTSRRTCASRAASTTCCASRASTATRASSRASTRSAKLAHGHLEDGRATRTARARSRSRSFPARRSRREAGRLLQGLPRLALGEGARLLDPGARAEGRARADRARVGHLLRRRRHPGGRARLLPAPERADPLLRGGDRLPTR